MNNDEFQKVVLEKLSSFDDNFKKIDKRFDAIDKKFVEIDKRFDAIDKKFVEIDKRFDDVDTEIKLLKSQTGENTKMIRALLTSTELIKAQQDNMANDINHMKGDLAKLKDNLCTMEVVTAQNYSDLAKLKLVK